MEDSVVVVDWLAALKGQLVSNNTSDLADIDLDRIEAVLSRLPVHNFSKKGRVDIQIAQKNFQGEIELRWEVSYNERYGPARQFAYKLDTIVLNRRIEEAGRPLPPLIRIGSLRDVTR